MSARVHLRTWPLRSFSLSSFWESSTPSVATPRILSRPLSTNRFATLRIDPVAESSTTKDSGGVEGGIDLKVLKVGGRVGTETSVTSGKRALTPSVVAESLKKHHGLLYIDEFDALRSTTHKHNISELIKQLSDNGSPFKVLIVGIADTAAELNTGHPSVQRCLKETKLGQNVRSGTQGPNRTGH